MLRNLHPRHPPKFPGLEIGLKLHNRPTPPRNYDPIILYEAWNFTNAPNTLRSIEIYSERFSRIRFPACTRPRNENDYLPSADATQRRRNTTSSQHNVVATTLPCKRARLCVSTSASNLGAVVVTAVVRARSSRDGRTIATAFT